ncbi:MAG: M18 family aminopeptidase [Candidatus Amulumruptor caecigallinarius]|nr:M18 family aminopeptidase [Candidatus Amulumruptor caecigallinarius]MCM1396744.1 M18 family aminopeptidase [Candidatus Amulumruptor caecigallinarius]MCM1453198.1 M18 family aminopeptidase [bacterium]
MHTSDNNTSARYGATVRGLMNFIDASPCNFLAVDTLREILRAEGFTCLDPRLKWDVKAGGRYYVTFNDSALMAFIAGEGEPAEGFRIISAHSDSPGFRIKPSAEMLCEGGIVKLNTEVYGGPILYTWFDRPLSMAGRVIVRSSDPLNPTRMNVRFNHPLLTIPHLAIHFNRGVNDGNPLSRQKDMLPVLGMVSGETERHGLLRHLIAAEASIDPMDILDFDMTLYDVTPACQLGLHGKFISAGRLDDLSMVHAAVSALTAAEAGRRQTRVMAIFDNEETGSGTKQGAASPILEQTLRRVTMALGGTEEDYLRGVAASFMVSADNAHGIHPNYPEKHDPTNHPVLGGGPVIKINANCKYMTDADSAAVFRSVCEEAGVPVQYFVNHSDVAGGSTLGNILTSQIPLRGVDMGAPLWAMHSIRETASAADHIATIAAFTRFYNL